MSAKLTNSSELDPYSPFDSHGYIRGLDGLRAISVLLVMVAHFGFTKVVPGGLGVTVFFFISGFLITSLLTREHRRSGIINIKNFYLRRLLRLSPELWLMMIVTSAIGFYASVRALDVYAAISYLTNYYVLAAEKIGAEVRWPHLWSLAVEEHFYLLFPLVLSTTVRNQRALVHLLILVCSAALGWRCFVVFNHAPFSLIEHAEFHPYTYVATECRIDSIAYGCLTALLFGRLGHRLETYQRASAFALACGAGLLLLTLVIRNFEFRETFRYSVQGIALIGIFLGLFFSPIGAWLRASVLELRPLRWAGRVSYAAYLWHMELVFLAEHMLNRRLYSLPLPEKLAFGAVAIIATLLVAHLSSLAVAPISRVRTKLSHQAAPAAS